jgi:anti-sigma B factor antagonist
MRRVGSVINVNVSTGLDVAEGTATVRLGGDLDVDAIDPVRQVFVTALAAPGVHTLVVDLADTGFLDSTALGALVGAYRQATAAGWTFRVVHLRGEVRRLLAMTGTLDLLTGGNVHAPTPEAEPTGA